VERRHLSDPLKPYLAPIRVDLPTFHIPIEYSVEQLPILAPVIVHYPNGTGDFSRYNGGCVGPKSPAISEWKLEGSTEASPKGPALDDVKIVKKRRRVKAEKPEKRVIVRELRRFRTSSVTTKRVKSCTNDVSPKPSPTAELSLQGQLGPTVKLEPVEYEHQFIHAPVRIFQHTAVIKKVP